MARLGITQQSFLAKSGIALVKKFKAATPRTLYFWKEEIVPSCRGNTILLLKEAELGSFLTSVCARFQP